jgi:hypothetical protein
MTVREKVAAAEFAAQTVLEPEAIRKAGQRSAEAGKRYLTSTIYEKDVQPGGIGYVVKGPGGLAQQMTFTVTWTEPSNGLRRVSLQVGDFITGQSTFMFIPIGPKTVPALGSLKRFAEALRGELS